MTLKLGIIGLSEGNGHPYSWGAIFNGYNREAMEECGFPVIPRYLERQKWPESQIPGAEVIAIWTQDNRLSEKVAKAALIETIVQQPEDMLGMIDALLLARDDAENHLEHAAPFLKAGIPVYIDKPIALSARELEQLYALEQYSGQIFTCSALRYSEELEMTQEDKLQLGKIFQIIATTPKNWDKYAVHIIEPVLKMLPKNDVPVTFSKFGPARARDDAHSLVVGWKSGIQTSFFATGSAMAPLSIRVFGSDSWKEFIFSDSFQAFTAALTAFISGIKNREIVSPHDFNCRVVSILEKGRS